jgi:hypothetical protein
VTLGRAIARIQRFMLHSIQSPQGELRQMTVVEGVCRTGLDNTTIHLADTDAEAGFR